MQLYSLLCNYTGICYLDFAAYRSLSGVHSFFGDIENVRLEEVGYPPVIARNLLNIVGFKFLPVYIRV
jgi:hypothetical protein